MADKIRVNSSFDMKGNYEPSDSEDEYSSKEKRLLDKVRKRKHDSESEEEMYAFSESDDDSDAKKDDMGIADSDVEGQEHSDDDLPDSKAWGKQKKSFYATDYVDEDYGGFGNEEQQALMEEEEAKNIQKRLLEQLGEEDFTLDFFSKQVAEVEDKETVIKSDLSQMSKRQKLQLLEKESPEFTGLIDDFKTKLTVAKDDLHPVLELVKDGKLPTCPASKFVKTNYDLILNYCTNISFYLLLKSQRINIQNHPVIKRLYQYRQMLNKMEPIYLEVVKPQIDRILEVVQNNLELQVKGLKKKGGKKRKTTKSVSKSTPKKLKLISALEKDEAEDTGVSDDEGNYEGNDFFRAEAQKSTQRSEESEESGFSDNDNASQLEVDEENKPSTSDMVTEEVVDKRQITYQIAKNKGLTPHRKKEQRNPRVKHKLKYRKAKIRRKGAIREARSEVSRYSGEASGIKANVKKSIKIK
ncbi:putative something about silencing protein 10 [Operophtera brumata]|uniref:Putative something about silencing protein 10 n=1 Tax=Operophtera brumata TaxID=104452 RepID=A0A0L7KYY1_OPEBR|nr:putative something about silencing protein 10 [Operophtera brumata]